jgi:hypothetical protein
MTPVGNSLGNPESHAVEEASFVFPVHSFVHNRGRHGGILTKGRVVRRLTLTPTLFQSSLRELKRRDDDLKSGNCGRHRKKPLTLMDGPRASRLCSAVPFAMSGLRVCDRLAGLEADGEPRAG